MNRKQIITVTLISLMLVATAVGLDVCLKNGLFDKKEEQLPVYEESPAATPSGYVYSDKIKSKLTEIEDEPYVPGPDVLNLAYYYPDGADTSDVMNSFAGRIYKNLAVKDADYFSTIYDMGDKNPLELARSLGYGAERVAAKYNPTDPQQDPENPSTWTVSRFKNVNVAFYDGDGNRVNGYSTVKEILSMASVYAYYHNMTDADAMEAYANELWNKAHSYTVSMGNVYYCSGCLNKTVQEEALEAIEQEKQQRELEKSLSENTADSSGNSAAFYAEETGFSVEEPGNASEAPKILYAPSPSKEGGSGEETAETKGDYVNSGAGDVKNPPRILVPEESSQDSAESSGNEPSIEVMQIEDRGLAGLYYGDRPIKSQMLASNDIVIETRATTAPSESASENTKQSASESKAPVAGTQETSGADANKEESVPGTIFAPGITEEVGPGLTDSYFEQVSGGEQESSVSEQASEKAELSADESSALTAAEIVTNCPGHVDLYITVTLYGIDDNNGLMSIDSIGNDPANFNENWQGWTKDKREQARSLNSADWFKRYGLTISAINVRNPLSEAEINAYLDRMPADISQQRRDIVSFALHSVGKVPYYWGGKPNGQGYESNNFGMLMSPDTKDRVLKGLDCSGWINWVYWSVLGSPLASESTGTLIGCGEKISRSELKPGDIMVRIGADAHVVMFIEWADNGNMVVVHETGGVINNVTVSEMSADWPYYRRLIE